MGELTKRESIRKRTSANLVSELVEMKLNPVRDTEHIETEPLDEVDRGLDDLLKDALNRFRDDINDSSDSDSDASIREEKEYHRPTKSAAVVEQHNTKEFDTDSDSDEFGAVNLEHETGPSDGSN